MHHFRAIHTVYGLASSTRPRQRNEGIISRISRIFGGLTPEQLPPFHLTGPISPILLDKWPHFDPQIGLPNAALVATNVDRKSLRSPECVKHTKILCNYMCSSH